MPQEKRVLTAILVIVNECMGILGAPQLDKRQQAILVCILAGMARKPKPLQIPFNKRLIGVMRMESGAGQRSALCAVLGMRLSSELHTPQHGSILVQDGRQ